MKTKIIALTALCALCLSAVHAQSPTSGESPAVSLAQGEVERGIAAWYGKKFAGRKTASGMRFNPNALTAAHSSLPFGTRVRVTNIDNQRSVELTINDRGPSTPNRIIDVSLAGARELGFVRQGLATVTIEIVP